MQGRDYSSKTNGTCNLCRLDLETGRGGERWVLKRKKEVKTSLIRLLCHAKECWLYSTGNGSQCWGVRLKKRQKISTLGKPSAVPPTCSETTRHRKVEKPPLHHRPATPVNWLVLKVKPCPHSRTPQNSAVPRVLMCKGLRSRCQRKMYQNRRRKSVTKF